MKSTSSLYQPEKEPDMAFNASGDETAKHSYTFQ